MKEKSFIEQPQIENENSDSRKFKEKFEPQAYLEAYYPEHIDIEEFSRAMEYIQNEILNNYGKVNIENIVDKTKLPHETVENITIFDFQRRAIKRLLGAFPENNINVLDVGGGPTIYQHIITSFEAGKITHSEYLEQNRKEVTGWINQEEGSYNWDEYFKLIQSILKNDEDYMSQLQENVNSDNRETRDHAKKVFNLLNSESIDDLKLHLRGVLKEVTHGDVFKSGLGLEDEREYDAVTALGREANINLLTSSFTIESATSDRATWERGMKNIIEMIKPGGFLSLSAIKNAEWYQVGDERMPAIKIDENEITAYFKKNNFQILEITVLEGSDKNKVGYDGMVFVFAQKLS